MTVKEKIIKEVKTSTEMVHIEGDSTKNYPAESYTLSHKKSKDNPYQKEFLLYVEGFVDEDVIKIDSPNLSPQTRPKG